MVVGAASASYLGEVNVMVVGYVAVRADVRGEGLGPRLRRGLRRKCEPDARRVGHSHLKAVIGEVHAGNPWLRSLVHREGAIEDETLHNLERDLDIEEMTLFAQRDF